MLYKVIYNDGIEYEGGNLIDHKWRDLRIDKGIKKVIYYNPFGKEIELSGWDEYLFRVEVILRIFNNGKNIPTIESTHLYGRNNERTIEYKIDYRKKITVEKIYDSNDKEITRLNPSYWRPLIK